jgi:hypothetical protein
MPAGPGERTPILLSFRSMSSPGLLIGASRRELLPLPAPVPLIGASRRDLGDEEQAPEAVALREVHGPLRVERGLVPRGRPESFRVCFLGISGVQDESGEKSTLGAASKECLECRTHFPFPYREEMRRGSFCIRASWRIRAWARFSTIPCIGNHFLWNRTRAV